MHLKVPAGYWDLPEDERLAEAGRLAEELRSGIAGQAVGLAWHYNPAESRDSHGRWTRGIAGQVAKIEEHQASALRSVPQAKEVSPLSAPVEALLKGNAEPVGRSPEQARMASLDHRMVLAHTKNAVHQIELAKQDGSLSGPEAARISSAVDSLSKTAMAGEREVRRLQEEADERDKRIAALETAFQELTRRNREEQGNAMIRDRIQAIRTEHDEMIEKVHESAVKKSTVLTSVGATLGNLAVVLGGFFTLPGATPVSAHEWLLAVVPGVAMIAQSFAQPLLQQHKEQKALKKIQNVKSKSVSAQLANVSADVRDGAVRFLTQIFQQAGLQMSEALTLAGSLVDEKLA